MKRRHTEARKGRRGRKWFPSRMTGGALATSLPFGVAPAAVAAGADTGFIAAILAGVFSRFRNRGRK